MACNLLSVGNREYDKTIAKYLITSSVSDLIFNQRRSSRKRCMEHIEESCDYWLTSMTRRLGKHGTCFFCDTVCAVAGSLHLVVSLCAGLLVSCTSLSPMAAHCDMFLCEYFTLCVGIEKGEGNVYCQLLWVVCVRWGTQTHNVFLPSPPRHSWHFACWRAWKGWER